ncbi:MAG: hypothetical protein H8E54_11125 [Candidatus Aminicenantes bacterium]|nr:hypothetical protein [Candidatus Aminicenantes bacterium]
MPIKPLKIIGINPGTRHLGIAIFLDSDLRDWRVKSFKEKWSKEKMEKIRNSILSIINQYEPNILAIKKLHPSRSSKNLKYLVTRIKELSKKRGLKVFQYSIKNMESFFLPREKSNKERLTKVITSEYQDLFHELKKERSNRNPYYTRMFEAVALASMCFHQLDN